MLLARNDRGAMETLVKRYTDAVWHQVRQFRGASEPDDLAQEGFLGLISAVCRYDSMRGVPFSAYAGKCITNSIVSALRRCRNLPLPVGTYDVPPLSQMQDKALPPDSVVQSRAQVDATEESLRIAAENLSISTYSYGEGLATILDVLQAQLSWIQLYSNAIRAHYNYAVAVSDYQRITAQ